MNPSIVIDTNVLLAALKSKRGASYRLLTLLGTDHFTLSISVPLLLEYEAVVSQYLVETGLSSNDLADILDYVCATSQHQRIYYLWRPFLKDTKDDMVLELAVAASSQVVITFNQKDFRGIEQFGLRAMTPKEFLEWIGVKQ